MKHTLQIVSHAYNVPLSDIAKILGVTRSSVNDWINRGKPLPKKHILPLSERFNLLGEYFTKELSEKEFIEVYEKGLSEIMSKEIKITA